jgi:hypothetical protein
MRKISDLALPTSEGRQLISSGLRTTQQWSHFSLFLF